MPLGEAQMGLHALVREEDPGQRLVERVHVVVQLEGRESAPGLVRLEHLVVKAVGLGALQRSVENGAPAPADVQPTGDLDQFARRSFGLDLRPEVPRRAEHGHVVGMLEVGEADDPRQPA